MFSIFGFFYKNGIQKPLFLTAAHFASASGGGVY
jgi:hypothetical protein